MGRSLPRPRLRRRWFASPAWSGDCPPEPAGRLSSPDRVAHPTKRAGDNEWKAFAGGGTHALYSLGYTARRVGGAFGAPVSENQLSEPSASRALHDSSRRSAVAICLRNRAAWTRKLSMAWPLLRLASALVRHRFS